MLNKTIGSRTVSVIPSIIMRQQTVHSLILASHVTGVVSVGGTIDGHSVSPLFSSVPSMALPLAVREGGEVCSAARQATGVAHPERRVLGSSKLPPLPSCRGQCRPVSKPNQKHSILKYSHSHGHSIFLLKYPVHMYNPDSFEQ